MPITQTPTVQQITDSKEFIISFGVTFSDTVPENIQTISVPNTIGLSGELFSIDLLSANTPARGNVPPIRSLGFSMNLFVEGIAPAPLNAPIYLWNPQTNQLYTFLVPLSGATVANYPGNLNGVIPFFCKSNQTIQIFKPLGANCLTTCSFSALTFDVSSFYAINQPNAFVVD